MKFHLNSFNDCQLTEQTQNSIANDQREITPNTPQPLYNTIVWVQANFRVRYPNRVITRVKYIVIMENKSKMTVWGPTLIRVISKTML